MQRFGGRNDRSDGNRERRNAPAPVSGSRVLRQCEFDDDNLVHQVGGVSFVLRHAPPASAFSWKANDAPVVESRNAPIWQRVAHAATMVAWSVGAIEDL
jgi:hypothetical protein